MQRKIGIDVVNKRRIKVAVINDSSIVRGIVTAASWFRVDIPKTRTHKGGLPRRTDYACCLRYGSCYRIRLARQR